MENRESKLASADQIFIDEDDLKSQNNKRPSDFLH